MSRRLVTDAKIVLTRAGYIVGDYEYRLYADIDCTCCGTRKSAGCLAVEDGTVDNAQLVDLLEERGYDEFGYRRN